MSEIVRKANPEDLIKLDAFKPYEGRNFEVQPFADIAQIGMYAPGERMITAGETDSRVYALISGEAGAFLSKYLREEARLGGVAEGEFFGEAPLVGIGEDWGVYRTASVISAKDCEVAIFDAEELIRTLYAESEVGVRVMHNLFETAFRRGIRS